MCLSEHEIITAGLSLSTCSASKLMSSNFKINAKWRHQFTKPF
jgi:hypothetical protein